MVQDIFKIILIKAFLRQSILEFWVISKLFKGTDVNITSSKCLNLLVIRKEWVRSESFEFFFGVLFNVSILFSLISTLNFNFIEWDSIEFLGPCDLIIIEISILIGSIKIIRSKDIDWEMSNLYPWLVFGILSKSPSATSLTLSIWTLNWSKLELHLVSLEFWIWVVIFWIDLVFSNQLAEINQVYFDISVWIYCNPCNLLSLFHVLVCQVHGSFQDKFAIITS